MQLHLVELTWTDVIKLCTSLSKLLIIFSILSSVYLLYFCH